MFFCRRTQLRVPPEAVTPKSLAEISRALGSFGNQRLRFGTARTFT